MGQSSLRSVSAQTDTGPAPSPTPVPPCLVLLRLAGQMERSGLRYENLECLEPQRGLDRLGQLRPRGHEA